MINTELPIGERIRNARKLKKLSQNELAKRIGIKQPSLSEIEKGDSTPREATLKSIVYELNDDLGEKQLREYLPAYVSPEELAISVSKLDNEFWMLERFICELAELVPKFRDALDENKYKKIAETAIKAKEIFNLDEFYDADSKEKEYSKNAIEFPVNDIK